MAATPAEFKQLKQQALRLLARREHTRCELETKLAQWARRQPGEAKPGETPAADSCAPAAAVAAVLDQLQQHDLLSDSRAAQALVRARGPRLGAARLRDELRRRGVADDLTQRAMAELDGSEEARARAVWLRRFGPEPAIDLASKARQARFLSARGFAGEVVRRVIRSGSDT